MKITDDSVTNLVIENVLNFYQPSLILNSKKTTKKNIHLYLQAITAVNFENSSSNCVIRYNGRKGTKKLPVGYLSKSTFPAALLSHSAKRHTRKKKKGLKGPARIF